MNILPREKMTFQTSMDEKEVLAKLNKLVLGEMPVDYYQEEDERSYIGDVYFEKNEFKIKRSNRNKNTAMTVLLGKLKKESGSTRVDMTMKLTNLMVFILSFWFFMMGMITVRGVMAILEGSPALDILIPVGITIGSILFFLLLFKLEEKTSKKFFTEFFQK